MLARDLPLERIDEDGFWNLVKDVVEQVFDGRGGDDIEPLRRQLAGRPEGEQILLYHREPLDVAGQLAQVDEIGEDRLERYRRLKAKHRWAIDPPPPSPD